jgi:hypothetical protein
VADGCHHFGIHLRPFEHEHQRGRRARQGARQPVAQADTAEAAEQAAGADQVQRGDAAAQPLERAPAESGVGVEGIVEGTDE